MSEALTMLCLAVVYAMGWSMGNLSGQIKMGREHLKFLRESSKRADEMHARMVESFARAGVDIETASTRPTHTTTEGK